VDGAQQTVECYRRNGTTYETVARHSGAVRFEHPDVPGLTIDTAPLWTEP
jgi:hypothetical protein